MGGFGQTQTGQADTNVVSVERKATKNATSRVDFMQDSTKDKRSSTNPAPWTGDDLECTTCMVGRIKESEHELSVPPSHCSKG